MASTIARIARALSVEAKAVTTVEDAREALLSWHPTEIMVDLRMPGTNGLEALDILASELADMPVYLCSGLGQSVIDAAQRVAQASQHNIRGRLEKPFSKDQLKALLFPEGSDASLAQGGQASNNRGSGLNANNVRKPSAVGRITFLFQPRLWALSRKPEGFEALIRILDDQEGLVSPARYSEELGEELSIELSSAALDPAMAWAAAELAPEGLTLSINISATAAHAPRSVERLLESAKKNHFPLELLVIEVSEQNGVLECEEAMKALLAAKLAGSRLSIGDFGMGSSTLDHFTDVPLDELKLDRKVAGKAAEVKQADAVARSVIDLAKRLGLRSIAEGVETQEVANHLTNLGCDCLQGFYFSGPLTARDASQWLESQSHSQTATAASALPSERPEKRAGADAWNVAIVDDDSAVRQTITTGLANFGINAHPFANGKDFLAGCADYDFDAAVLDLRMEGMSGIQVLRELPSTLKHLPILVLSSHGDMPTAIEAMKLGAIDFLEKPITFQKLSNAISEAINSRSVDRQRSETSAHAKETLAQLSKRELEVCELMFQGLRNKEIAQQLGISYRTVEIHRSNALKKLDARTASEVGKILAEAGHFDNP
ncbi:EAL domain-containing protein [Erythrobacter mangrovi]|uniref:EAL domain-containing protein n=2 Tax=Erythrobacter mangrovi TaxID=2739433 RepID=A0A7D4BQ09_9SPHN|nr:EAL domain-containing protein [Erythrobacter mangrovi]